MALAVFVPLAAYPLWWQFRGRQSYTSLRHGPIGNDILALGGYAQQSVVRAGRPPATWLAINSTENNGFFGWPLLILVLGVTIWLWRDRRTKAIALTGVVLAILSLGSRITIDRRATGIPGPWAGLMHLPAYDSVIQSRFTLACVPAIAAILALAAERLTHRALRAALVLALIPILPVPLSTTDTTQPPEFITAGIWKHYVRPHHTLVPIPVPRPQDASALGWEIDANLGFAVPEGYFLGPDGPTRHGIYGAPRRTLSVLTAQIADRNEPAPYTPGLAKAVRADLRYWRADAVVLTAQPADDALNLTLGRLLGQRPRFVGGVWVWKIR